MLAVIAGVGGAYALLGVVVAIAAGFAAGWYGRRLGEAARKQALDAYFREVVKVSEKARDRAREETAEVADKLERLRGEHAAYESNLHALTTQLRKARTTAADLKDQVTAGASNGNGSNGGADRATEPVPIHEDAAAGSDGNGNGTRHGNGNGNGNGRPQWVLTSPEGERDDLKVIKGLGPVLERSLNQLGVFHYRQLAGLTSSDVEWLTLRLRTFPGRIERDRWVEQARSLTDDV